MADYEKGKKFWETHDPFERLLQTPELPLLAYGAEWHELTEEEKQIVTTASQNES